MFTWKTRVFQFQSSQIKTGSDNIWFGYAFRHRVTNFKPHFLSPQKSKFKNFSAHQQEDFLRISKLTLLLFLLPFLKELWQFETSQHFFWHPGYLSSLLPQLSRACYHTALIHASEDKNTTRLPWYWPAFPYFLAPNKNFANLNKQSW